MSQMNPVTVVVPVYADWPSLKNCIVSLVSNISKPDQVILVNDCGPEVELIEKNIKAAIKGSPNFTYYRNPKNLGFVGTCNRAVLEIDKTNNDILLLNSDTKTTLGFLEELKGVLNANTKHAAVSPRSNNATLCTVPLWAASQKGVDAQESYKIYKKIKDKLPRYEVAPVAHGFCMLIRRSVIKEFGLFDVAFGKGYGEEVDFCQRVAKAGYESVISNGSYVFHLEAKSFSLESKAKMLEQNNQIIWERYPNYRQEVRDYMKKIAEAEAKILKSLGLYKPEKSSLRERLARRLFAGS